MTNERFRRKNRLFGFLLGSTLSGAGVYSYVLSEYKTSNELLTEDIYVRHIPTYITHPPTLAPPPPFHLSVL